MKDRNTAIMLTVGSAILCGCQGLFIGIAGLIVALGSQEFDISFFMGLSFVCLGLVLVLIPIGVGFFTLRRPREKITEEDLALDEQLPPAI